MKTLNKSAGAWLNLHQCPENIIQSTATRRCVYIVLVHYKNIYGENSKYDEIYIAITSLFKSERATRLKKNKNFILINDFLLSINKHDLQGNLYKLYSR